MKKFIQKVIVFTATAVFLFSACVFGASAACSTTVQPGCNANSCKNAVCVGSNCKTNDCSSGNCKTIVVSNSNCGNNCNNSAVCDAIKEACGANNSKVCGTTAKKCNNSVKSCRITVKCSKATTTKCKRNMIS